MERRAKRGRAGYTLLEIMIVVSIIAMLAVLLLPALWRAREVSCRTVCLNNLRQIEMAKAQCAIARAGSAGAIPEEEVDVYIRAGHPRCPAGGTYSYGAIGTNPVCSVEGHVL